MLLYLDLDNFKAVNDRFGHAAGDCLLVAVASRLQELVRTSDTVARLGGDEFVVLAEGLDDAPAAARTLAERIHVAMRPPVAMGDRDLYTSVSIGIAEVMRDVNPEVNLAHADAAMYQAKRRWTGPLRALQRRDRRGQPAPEPTGPRPAGGPPVPAALGSTTSRCSGWAGTWWGWRPCYGGTTPSWAPSPRSSSCPLLERSREIIPVGRWVLHEAAGQCRRVAGAGPPRPDRVGQCLGPPVAGPRLLR